MKDKLYKTNKTKKYYRSRNFLVGFLLFLVAGTALVLPYQYVTEAVRAYQVSEKEDTPLLISEELPPSEE